AFATIVRWLKHRAHEAFPHESHPDPIIDAVLQLCRFRHDGRTAQDAFMAFHDAVQSYIVMVAYNPDANIDLLPLLPPCRPGQAVYCDGRIWPDKKLHAYCPHTRRPCAIRHESEDTGHARLVPLLALPAPECSLQELFSLLQVVPMNSERDKPEEYV